MRCPTCGGEPTLLGTLGALDWYRCSQCGAEWHSSEKLDATVLAEPEEYSPCGWDDCGPGCERGDSDDDQDVDPRDGDWREP